MAHRQQVAQPRTCVQSPTVFLTARKGHLYLQYSGLARASPPRLPLLVQPRCPASPLNLPHAAPAVHVALSTQSVRTVAVGNALTALLAHVFTGPATPAPPRP